MKLLKKISSKIESLRGLDRKYSGELISINLAEQTLKSELEKRQKTISTVRDQKDRIRVLREKKAKEFSARLGRTVTIDLVPDGNTADYETFISSVMKGRYMSREVIQQLCKSIYRWALAEYLRVRDHEKICNLSHIDQRWSKMLIEVLNSEPERIINLEAVPMEDLLEIKYKVGDQYKPLEKLSTGQKATVIVLLSMIEGKEPIVFDQPEDALYTPFIYDDVVKTLKEEKETRQFIFATHNSNLAIGGDTDYGIVLDSTADQTQITTSGGLDDNDTRNAMLIVLEGGEKALRVRIEKFGLSKKKSQYQS